MKVHRYQAVLENDQTSSKKATEQKYQNRSNGRLEGCCYYKFGVIKEVAMPRKHA